MKKKESPKEQFNREVAEMPILVKILIIIVAVAILIIVNVNLLS